MNKKRELKIRKKIKGRKPDFKRQEGYRHVRLKDSWRKPRGRHSKLRMREKARGRHPSPGYSSPKAARGLNRQGFREIRVFNADELGKINTEEEIAVIAGGVGKKKRLEIRKMAEKLGVKTLDAKP